MASKHLLMVIDSLAMGGAEKVVATLSEGFLSLGNTVDVIIIDAKQELELSKEISIHTLGFEKGMFAYVRYKQRLFDLVGLISKAYPNGFDGIFVHLQKATRLMRDYAHPKLFFCVHSTISQSSMRGRSGLRLLAKKRRLQSIYDGLDIITVSDGIKEDLVESVGVKAKSIRTIHNPVDIEGVLGLSKLVVPNIPEGDYIIHVGRLAESKRHDRLINAYVASGIDAKLLIVGEGEMRSAIEVQIASYGLEKKILLYGFASNPYPLMAQARSLVLSSDYEGFGNVLVEALSLDIPVVSTDCPSGPKEILTGVLKSQLVPVDDIQRLAERIKSAVSGSKELYYPSFAREFDVKNIVGEYLRLL